MDSRKKLFGKFLQWAAVWGGFAFCAIAVTAVYALTYNWADPSALRGKAAGNQLQSSQWNLLVGNVDNLNERLAGAEATVATLSAWTPTGAIMAFNLASCPAWWSAFSQTNGKTIVWVGSDGQWNTYSLLNSWGEARHTLTAAEMPGHNHAVTASDVLNTGAFIINDHGGDGIVSSDNFNPAYIETRSNRYFTDSAGGSQSHENRMPYVALLYCVKN